ncbi:putative short-chain dehydrogenase/reductase family 42E member 2 [Protobothrops mucrosquamatus]|uniref:putative short-chain dehydrogenase/reductase family 42E member 2 n=1 Tax=Protobothrops mucrosquamatus TaxID=103944 RepID=UPI0010FB6E63|nr:putative short-chain dehydrogenase/reductase family 42E member 2 [Protobothrops mucrosquamatus]
MSHHREDILPRTSGEKVIHGGEPSVWKIPRQMGSFGPKAMITGGMGYCGFHLGCALLQEGIGVVLLDRSEPKRDLPQGAVFVQADVRDYEKVFQASEGIDTMFHLASFGMSGDEQVKKFEEIESINVGGTKVVIDVCKSRNISKLIYTSSVTVIFGGDPIEDGDETLPYFPLEKQADNYSRSKTIAEQMILAANGASLQGGGTLRTCALRPSGIYGPGENKIIPRIFKTIQTYLKYFTFDTTGTWMNWVDIYNLIQACLLASRALTAERNFIASGQAYFVNDGEKVNFFEWTSVVYKTLGRQKPRLILPGVLLKIAVTMAEYLYWVLKPIFNITPLLTKREVEHLLVTYTFRIDKARKQLGYHPKKYSLAEVMDDYLRRKSMCEEKGCPS